MVDQEEMSKTTPMKAEVNQNFIVETEANEIINDRMKYNELNEYFLSKVGKRWNERTARRFIHSGCALRYETHHGWRAPPALR